MAADLNGRTAIVTGASRGSRKQEAADAAASSLGSEQAVGFGAHATDEEAAAACFDFAVQRFGSLDILVNNAGTNPPSHDAPHRVLGAA